MVSGILASMSFLLDAQRGRNKIPSFQPQPRSIRDMFRIAQRLLGEGKYAVDLAMFFLDSVKWYFACLSGCVVDQCALNTLTLQTDCSVGQEILVITSFIYRDKIQQQCFKWWWFLRV